MFSDRNELLQDTDITGKNGELYDKQDEIRVHMDNFFSNGIKFLENSISKDNYLNSKTELENYLKDNGLNGTIEDYIEILYDDFGIMNFYWELEAELKIE